MTHVSFTEVPQVPAQIPGWGRTGTTHASYAANCCHLGFTFGPGRTQKGRRQAGRSVVMGVALSPMSFWAALYSGGQGAGWQSWRGCAGQPSGCAGPSRHERPRVSSLAPESPSLTFVTGVRLRAIVMVNFIDSPWLAMWTVTARKHGKGTRWALHPHTVLSFPQVPPSPALHLTQVSREPALSCLIPLTTHGHS